MTLFSVAKIAALTSALMLAATPIWAQDAFPSRSLRIVVPTSPGSGSDIVGRYFAEQLSTVLGQSVVVENRAGGNGVIAAMAVKQAPADGHTLFLGTNTHLAVNPVVIKDIPYDALKDFTPVSVLVSFPQVVTTSPKQPFKNFPEFVAAVKAQPDKMAYSSSGQGSTSHLVMELIRADAGLKITHVSYRGDSLATQAVMAGDVQVTVGGLPSMSPLMRGGNVRPLAVTSNKRSPQFPDVPSMAEFIPGFDATAWVLLMAPAGTPPAVVNRISAEVAKALTDPQLRQALDAQGVTPVGGSPAESAAFHRKELDKFKRAVELSGATME